VASWSRCAASSAICRVSSSIRTASGDGLGSGGGVGTVGGVAGVMGCATLLRDCLRAMLRGIPLRIFLRTGMGLFHLVWNLNISPQAMAAMPDGRRDAVINAMSAALNELKRDISQYVKRPAELTTCQFFVEIGPQRKHLHVDGILQFASPTQLELNRIRDMLNRHQKPHSLGTHFHVRYVRDEVALVRAYAAKDGVRLL